MYEPGLIALAAALVLMLKLPTHWIRRMLWLDIYVDVAVTAGFIAMLHGTYSGMMAAAVAGLAFSLVLWITKQFIGYEKLTWNHTKRRPQWTLVKP